jgi:hypothetical protein
MLFQRFSPITSYLWNQYGAPRRSALLHQCFTRRGKGHASNFIRSKNHRNASSGCRGAVLGRIAQRLCAISAAGKTKRQDQAHLDFAVSPKLGDFDKINADQARKIAIRHFGQILDGVDPAAEKEAARVEAARLTFSQGVAQYLEAKVKELRPNSFKAVQLYLVDPKYFGPLHKRHLHKIEQRDIAQHLDRINNENGTATAGQARAHLSSLFTWCMKRGHCAENPVIALMRAAPGIGRFRLTSCGRYGIPAPMMTSAGS